MTRTRTTRNSQRAGVLESISANPRRTSQIVEAFTSFSQCRGGVPISHTPPISASIYELPSPKTPSCPHKSPSPSNPPSGGDSDDEENWVDEPEENPDFAAYPGGDGGGGGGDDDDTEIDSSDLNPETRVMLQLSRAISSLARSSRRTSHNSDSSKAKVHEPDTFDGTDPCKLRAFLVQCELHFRNRPRAFNTDGAKVTFAQSYLKGMALEWFEPDLL